MEDDIRETAELLDQLKSRLQDHVEPELKDLPSLVPYRVTYFKGAVCHRAADLCTNALPLFEAKQLIPACLIVRSIMETVALLYQLHKKIVAAIDREELAALEVFLDKAALGSKNDDTDVEAVNVLTALENMEEEYGGVVEMYAELSEFCHPNFAGVLASYSRVNRESTALLLGPDQDPPMLHASAPLVVSMRLALHYRDSIDRNYRKILEIAEC